MNRFAAYWVIALSTGLGGGSLLLFGAFLIVGPFSVIRFDASEGQVLIWNGFLSILFFIQHSGMIRAAFRTWLALAIPRHYHPAIYAIVSGIVLTFVVLLWQTSQTVIFRIQSPLQVLPRVISLLAIAGFIWGVQALGTFDAFGGSPLWSISAASNSDHQTLSSGGPISGSAILFISSCLFLSGQLLT